MLPVCLLSRARSFSSLTLYLAVAAERLAPDGGGNSARLRPLGAGSPPGLALKVPHRVGV